MRDASAESDLLGRVGALGMMARPWSNSEKVSQLDESVEESVLLLSTLRDRLRLREAESEWAAGGESATTDEVSDSSLDEELSRRRRFRLPGAEAGMMILASGLEGGSKSKDS